MAPSPRIILGSTSRYRRELLQRLRLRFDVEAPRIDEAALAGEALAALARRLALAKADQVAELDGQAIGKPGNHERAVAQLRSMSGRSVVFHTAVAVVHRAAGFEAEALVPVTVRFRTLDAASIERYLLLEQPYDCAGSAKCETLGIALLEAIESDDPTALVGLPLIRTCELLRRAGVDPLAQ